MALRSQALFIFFCCITAAAAAAQTFEIRGGGTLTVDGEGLTYRDKKAHTQVWTYPHLQEVFVQESKLQIVTYEDSPRWKLGVDRKFEFTLADPSKSFRPVYDLLKTRLDQRFVGAIAEVPDKPQWSLLVKRLGTLRGSEGTLYVAEDRIVYRSAVPGESRTWRMQDIENVNSSGRFELTLTTYERARMHYGSMRSFNFRLKEAIDPARVDELWKRLESAHRPKS